MVVFLVEDEIGFVVKLMILVVGVGNVDDVVKIVLCLLVESGVIDYVESEFEGVEGFVVEGFGLKID